MFLLIAGNQRDRRPHKPATPHSLFHLFTFAIVLNLVAILLTWLCLRFKFGRKTTFLSANLLASLFTLLTGIFLGSPPLESVISSSKHDLSHLEVLKQQVNVTLVFYSLAKIFQASTYLVLLIWLYELLPPIAECSVALRACFTLANFQLAFMPFLLYAAVSRYVGSFAENNDILFWCTGKIIETFYLHSRCVGGNTTKDKPSGHSPPLPGVRRTSLSIWAAVPNFTGNGFYRATAVQSAGGRAIQCLLGNCCFFNLRRSTNGKVVLTQGSLQFSCTKVSYHTNFSDDVIKGH